jgi:hypothetical protein
MTNDDDSRFFGADALPPDDLDILQEWANEIGKLLYRQAGPDGITLEDGPTLTKENAWRFRPWTTVQDSLIRLETRFPQAIAQIEERRKEAELFYRRCEGRDFEGLNDGDPFADAICDLMWRVKKTVQIMRGSESHEPLAPSSQTTNLATSDTSSDTKKDFPPKMPETPDVRDLIQRLQVELPKGKSQSQIAREFTCETTGDEPKAQSLLRQARRYRCLWDNSDT